MALLTSRLKNSAYSVLIAALMTVSANTCRAGSASDFVERPTLKAGDSWKYRTMNYRTQEATGSFVLAITFANERAIQSIVTPEGGTGEYDATYTAEWNQVSSARSTVYTPHRSMFRFPLSVGDVWHTAYRVEIPKSSLVISHKREVKVVAWEDVTVPAGRFHALRIESVGTFERSDHPGNFGQIKDIYWYVPEVKRFVKSESEDTSVVTGQPSRWVGQELLEYKLQ